MSAILVDLCEAMVAQLGSLTWNGEPFHVSRTYSEVDERLEATEGEGLRADVVVPDGFDDVVLETREGMKYTATVEVVLRKRLGTEMQSGKSGDLEQAELDSLVLLAETIGRSATYDRMPNYVEAAWLKTEHDPLFDRKHLRDLHQFTSVILLTFEISQSL